MKSLPPGVNGEEQGSLKLTVGSLEWLTYDSKNFLEEKAKNKTSPLASDVFANITFWGEQSNPTGGKGTYLHF